MELVATDLSCERGGRLVFSHVSFAIASGQLLEITGPNGAGKSTLLRLVMGSSEAVKGQLTLNGGSAAFSISQQAHYVAHQDAVKPALSVEENLSFWANFLGGGDVGKGLRSFDLETLASYPAGLLSAGQKRRLALSRLALSLRMIWLLDEPTVGLDASSRDRLLGLIRGHLSEGGLILVATHVAIGVRPDVCVTLGDSR